MLGISTCFLVIKYAKLLNPSSVHASGKFSCFSSCIRHVCEKEKRIEYIYIHILLLYIYIYIYIYMLLETSLKESNYIALNKN